MTRNIQHLPTVIEFDPELLTIGEYRPISLKAKRSAEVCRIVAEAVLSHFEATPDKHAYPIDGVGELGPEDRRDVRTWLEDHLPLGDPDYRWDVGFRDGGFELVIKRKPVRARR